MKYFKQDRGWMDTLASEMHPGVLANKGWTEITLTEYTAIRTPPKKAKKSTKG